MILFFLVISIGYRYQIDLCRKSEILEHLFDNEIRETGKKTKMLRYYYYYFHPSLA